MLSAEDNRLLTESGAGTPMGELLRRFWMPALLSEELPERDGPPKKITVMGEDLLAFRDTDGRVGIIEQHCPHRGANLWLGRNEECGIRCVYHGWKFDVDGQLRRHADLLARPQRQGQDAHHGLSGARVGRHGLGLHGAARAHAGAAALEVALVPASHRYVTKKWQDCNWVQAMEGSIDTAHFSFAAPDLRQGRARGPRHRQGTSASPMSRMNFDHVRWIADDPRPVIKVNAHDAGLAIGGGAHAADDNIYWRIAQFLMPDPRLRAERHAGREHVRPVLGAGRPTPPAGSTPTPGTPSGPSPTPSAPCTRAATASSPRSTTTTCRCATRATTT